MQLAGDARGKGRDLKYRQRICIQIWGRVGWEIIPRGGKPRKGVDKVPLPGRCDALKEEAIFLEEGKQKELRSFWHRLKLNPDDSDGEIGTGHFPTSAGVWPGKGTQQQALGRPRSIPSAADITMTTPPLNCQSSLMHHKEVKLHWHI